MEKFVCVVHSAMCLKSHVSVVRVRWSVKWISLGIFSSTIKNNILFGKEYDQKLFQRVIQASALDTVCQMNDELLTSLCIL